MSVKCGHGVSATAISFLHFFSFPFEKSANHINVVRLIGPMLDRTPDNQSATKPRRIPKIKAGSVRQQAFRYRIFPTKAQEAMFRKIAGCCRFVYNQALAARR